MFYLASSMKQRRIQDSSSGNLGVQTQNISGPRPSNSLKYGETPYLKRFLTLLDKSRGSYFEKCRSRPQFLPLGTPLVWGIGRLGVINSLGMSIN